MSFTYLQTLAEQGVTVRLVADSHSPSKASRVTTFELEYPRFIHSELMTHRLFSRNAMSSRAVPITKMIENSNVKPITWGSNQAGMQAGKDLSGMNLVQAQRTWEAARASAADNAEFLSKVGLHKQVANRILEPFQLMKTIVTATEWDNFFTLRLSPDAQPEIQLLARLMKEAMDANTPSVLRPHEWHTPYVEHLDAPDGSDEIAYTVFDDGVEKYLTKAEALAISSSCCAQVSYRGIDNSFDKAMSIFEKLGVGTPNFHASPFEHIAKPMEFENIFDDPDSESNFKESFKFLLDGQNGITHVDGKGDLWSANFKGFIQYRQTL